MSSFLLLQQPHTGLKTNSTSQRFFSPQYVRQPPLFIWQIQEIMVKLYRYKLKYSHVNGRKDKLLLG